MNIKIVWPILLPTIPQCTPPDDLKLSQMRGSFLCSLLRSPRNKWNSSRMDYFHILPQLSNERRRKKGGKVLMDRCSRSFTLSRSWKQILSLSKRRLTFYAHSSRSLCLPHLISRVFPKLAFSVIVADFNWLFDRCVCSVLTSTFHLSTPGLVNFVPAVASHFCLRMPAALSQPGNGLIVKHI